MNVWDSYKIGLRISPGPSEYPTSDIQENRGMIKNFYSSIYHLADRVFPIDYVRWRELSFVLGAVEKYLPSQGKILDVSSPKLLPLTLAESLAGSLVYSIDILESEIAHVESARRQLRLNNLLCERMDARSLAFSDGSFDLITSISVLEHIAPEMGGEEPAVKEIHRVLSPNGIAILTVPFSRSYFAEFKKGTVYEREAPRGEDQFFQRFYDLDTLMERIVTVSLMDLISLGFIEERLFFQDPHKRLTHYISGTRLRTLIFGPLYPILSRIFLSSPKELDRCRKPYLACLVLKKR